jgi:peptide/nickel transport system ATP-binding protein
VNAPLLDVRGLTIRVGAVEVVRALSFTVAPGEVLALVGESGSGKTLTALSLLGLLPTAARVAAGRALFEAHDLLRLDPAIQSRIRGARIGMVFQEPMTALNPVLTIGLQMTEALRQHRGLDVGTARAQAEFWLRRVDIADPSSRLRQYPHQLSGGMRQRVMIAAAMALHPALLVADEPTTALDVTIQAQVLDLMRDLVREVGASLLLITHDMGVVAEMADRVLVLRAGAAVEEAPVARLFAAPRSDYTRALLAAVPRIDAATATAAPAAATPLLRIERIGKTFRPEGLWRRGSAVTALDGVDLDILPGEVVAVVGESGSGKSTLGRIVARLIAPDHGRILFRGIDLTALSGRRLRRARAGVQMVFQDPLASLDPWWPIGHAVAEPIVIHGLAGRREAHARACRLLHEVGLSEQMMTRLPRDFSGGQRQRIAIARALAAEPALLVADEPTSALDVSIQAQVLDLLAALQQRRGLSLLFISHDIAVVRRISHRVAVMRSGQIVEVGPTGAVLDDPRHGYTRALLSAVPLPDPARRQRARLPSPAVQAGASLVEVSPGHWVREAAA